MTEQLRCPQCGGLNPADAQWCGQCLTRFQPPAPPPPAPPVAVAAPPAPISTTAPDSTTQEERDPLEFLEAMASEPSAAPPPEAVGTERGAFKVTPAGIVWTCGRCQTENPLADQICSVCGAEFAETVREPTPEKPERDPGTTAMISLFFPGAGHAYLGMWGQAVARGILSLWSIGVFVAGALAKGTPARLITPTFALIALALWVVAAHDAMREANHQPSQVLMKPRYFLYVVMGILMLLFILLMVGFVGAQRAP